MDEEKAKKWLSWRAKNYSRNSKTSLRKPEKSQIRLWGDVFNQSPVRRLRDGSEMQPCRLGPAGMRCLWEISIRSLFRETSQRPIKNISEKMTFFVTSLRRLKYISKKMLFCNVFKTSQKHHQKKDFFCVTSLRLLEHIQKRWLFRDVQDVFWMSYVRSIYVLCLLGRLLQYQIK